ncbi:MAG: glycoside hydrolase family 10 protein, partial [Planctomycetota bacterium]
GTRHDRASWDREVRLDLTACRGLRFDFYCPDVAPISHFSFYLHSGDGWYAASFGQRAPRGWSHVVIDKTETRIEGSPGGWGRVDTLRVSAWRGRDVDTEFYIANLALEGADAPIAVVRGESVASVSADEAKSVATFSKGMADALDRLGLPYAVISDLDVTPERLEGKQVAILPHNPRMPDEVAEALATFIERGGKLLAFYTLHGRLAELLGVADRSHLRQSYPGHFASIRPVGEGLYGMPKAVGQRSWNIRRTSAVEGTSRVAAVWFNDKGESTGEPAILVSDRGVFMTHVLLGDDPASKQRLLLAMLGHLEPGLWERAVAATLERAGRFGPFDGFQDALAKLRGRGPAEPRVAQALEQAQASHALARKLLDGGEFPRALSAATEAHEALVLAFCRAQTPRADEHRAFWCHSAFGVQGMTWDEAVQTLAENGFTAVLPNMLWGGTAYYDGDVLPVAPEVAERGDQIAQCVAACRKHGVECHVWKVNWNMSHRAPKPFAERMRREGRIQVGFDGTPNPRWLCPSHPENQKLEIESMVEVATKYDVDGVHFDYIRYPGPSYCFCDGCRERFEAAIGRKVGRWPADCRHDPETETQWLDWRRGHITKVVAAVAQRVRKAKPKVEISAAVFRNWPIDRDKVGQDWKLWCDRGYLDFVCPMDYTPNNVTFEQMVRRQLQWSGEVPCYPGIGLSVWGSPRDVVKLIEQIQIARRLGTGGFTVFNYGVPEATRVLPLCGEGITRRATDGAGK